MKALILIFSMALCLPALTQETNNFKTDNGSLVWQKIYDTSLPTEAIVKHLKANGTVKNIDFSDNLLTGELDIAANYKNAGFTEMTIPMYIPRNNIVCSVTINFKEGRYRVILRNLKLKAITEDPVTKIRETSNLETYALKKGNTEFKTQFLKIPSTIYNYTFNQIFEIKAKTEDDNW